MQSLANAAGRCCNAVPDHSGPPGRQHTACVVMITNDMSRCSTNSISKAAATCRFSAQVRQMRATCIVEQQGARKLYVAGQAALTYARPTVSILRPDCTVETAMTKLLWQAQTTLFSADAQTRQPI
jgi:hypothetical protein